MLTLKLCLFAVLLIAVVVGMSYGILALIYRLDAITSKRGFRGLITWTKSLMRNWRNQMRKILAAVAGLFLAGVCAAQPVGIDSAVGGMYYRTWSTTADGAWRVCVRKTVDTPMSSTQSCRTYNNDSSIADGHYVPLTEAVPKGRVITHVQLIPMGDGYKLFPLVVYWK